MPSELFQTAFLPTRFSCRVGLSVHPKASDKQVVFRSRFPSKLKIINNHLFILYFYRIKNFIPVKVPT
ncbi:hypothetical protein, partial [Neisseria polysaccharea]|uniref:hypothetical protein n=1 Tax=Neisseria polysaccharea TaxID=489 RepID=UPI00272D4823